MGRTMADPFARSIGLAVALIVGGFVAIAIGWRGVARSIVVAEQLPYLVSGGLGGLALICAGAGLLTIQLTRYWNARERQRLDAILVRAGKRRATQAPAEGDSLTSRVSTPPK